MVKISHFLLISFNVVESVTVVQKNVDLFFILHFRYLSSI